MATLTAPAKLFAVDAEKNGLYGETISIAAKVVENGALVDSFYQEVNIDTISNLIPWVAENVTPLFDQQASAVQSETELLQAFAAFWHKHRQGACVVTHIGYPVETGIFAKMHQLGLIGDFEGPYQWVDISTLLMVKGHQFDNLNGFLESQGLPPANHHAMTDVDASIEAIKLLL